MATLAAEAAALLVFWSIELQTLHCCKTRFKELLMNQKLTIDQIIMINVWSPTFSFSLHKGLRDAASGFFWEKSQQHHLSLWNIFAFWGLQMEVKLVDYLR